MKTLAFITLLLTTALVKASEQDLYHFDWLDPDKSVFVLQNKVYDKKNSYFANFGYLSEFDSAYQSVSGLAIRGGYYFTEEFGLELLYNKYSAKNNDNYKNIQAINGSVPFVQSPDQIYGALLRWSPFYGKINTFNRIHYFDWSFSVGPSIIEVKNNRETVVNPAVPSTMKSESYTGAIIKSDMKFYINKRWSVGLEYQHTMYQAPQVLNPGTDTIYTHKDVIFFIGLSF